MVAIVPPLIALATVKRWTEGRLNRMKVFWIGVASVLLLQLALDVCGAGLKPWDVGFWTAIRTAGLLSFRFWQQETGHIGAALSYITILPAIFIFWWLKMCRVARNSKRKWPERTVLIYIVGVLCLGVALMVPKAQARPGQWDFSRIGAHQISAILVGLAVLCLPVILYLRFWEWIGGRFLLKRGQNIAGGMDSAN